jgi:2'-hydroxyisoflavone reductase
VAQGGAVLVPGRPGKPVQVIDARDLAAWCVQLAQARTAGTFHAVGPQLTMQSVLETCREVSRSDARFVWRDDAELLRAEVAPWTGLPLWLPESDDDFGGMLLGHNGRAVAAGLRCRPLSDTISDILDALRSEPDAARFPNVITREAESALVGEAR